METKKLYIIGFIIGLAIAIGAIVIVSMQPTKAPELNQDAFVSWQTVTPPNNLFTTRFPSPPQLSATEIPIANSDVNILQEIHTAKDAKDNIYYVVSFVYPQPFDINKSEEVMQIALDGMVAGVKGNELIESVVSEFKGNPSLEFVIKDPQQIIHQGKMIIKDRVLYQVFVSYPVDNLSEEEYRYFFESFAI